jgi:hypothetical protein
MQGNLLQEGVMQGKVLGIFCLVALILGCQRRAGDTGAASDTMAAPASETTANAAVSGKPEILAVTVRVRTAEGREGDVQVDLDKIEGSDALFLSMKAVENFVVPFYKGRKGEGPDSAAAILKDAKSQLEKNGFIIILHKLKCKMLIPRDLLGGQFPRKL